ncbi:MAG: FepC-type transporter protein [Caulobacteraceae bacterium]|nr:FepC-type transporter protein [Caulobacteraceae bacterium]
MSAAWRIENLSLSLNGRQVLNNIALTCAAGEVVGVVGPNGAGKTSMLRAGLGLIKAAEGRASLGGRSVESLGETARAALVAYLPQERRIGWNLPAFRVAALGAPNLADAAAESEARATLVRVGLGALAERGVLDMSGGERARVLLARLLVAKAPLLVADEPVAGLDPDAQLLTLELFRQEAKRGAAVVVTLHDLGLAARACDRLIVLTHGRVAAEGPPHQALSSKVLAEVFHLDGRLVESGDGPMLSARRL